MLEVSSGVGDDVKSSRLTGAWIFALQQPQFRFQVAGPTPNAARGSGLLTDW